MLFSKTFILIQVHLVLLLFALLCIMDVAFFFFYKLEETLSINKMIMTCLIAILDLVQWFDTCSISNIIYTNIDLISPYLCQYLFMSNFLISAKQIGIILFYCSFNFNFLNYTIELNIFLYVY